MEDLKTKIIAKIEQALGADNVELLDVLNRLLGTVLADILNTKLNKL
ncbi:MAG: hypothetical protein WC854_14290 [Bacteroidales bacterium]